MTNIPDALPQIWFEDSLGKVSYALVKVFKKEDYTQGYKIDSELIQSLVNYNGYYGEIIISSMFGRSKPLYRDDDKYRIEFSGLIDIEKQAAKCGVSQLNIKINSY